MDLALLEKDFEKTENPGLDTTDPRWAEVSGFAQEGKFDEAGKGAEQLLGEGVLDIRLLGYYLYGIFNEQGLATLARAMTALGRLLETQLEAFGPVATRPKAVQASLQWMFKQLLKRAQREEQTKSPVFRQWADSLTPDTLDETVKSVRLLQGVVDGALGELAPPLLDSISKLREWLGGLRAVVKQPEPPKVEEAPAEAAAEAPRGEAARPAQGGVDVKGSRALQELLQKITVFERLIADQKFPRAQIVADDINQTLASFDPLLFFPQLFSTYMRLAAVHVGELSQYESARDTPDWKALLLLYRVDMEAFVNL